MPGDRKRLQRENRRLRAELQSIRKELRAQPEQVDTVRLARKRMEQLDRLMAKVMMAP